MDGRNYAIAGVGVSDRSRKSGKSTLRLAVEAGRRALDDAGMKGSEIDAVLSYQDLDSADCHSVASYLGITPKYFNDTLGGGSATENLVATALGLMEAGLIKSALIYRSMNGRSEARMGGGGDGEGWSLADLWMRVFPATSFVAPYGITTAADQFAMVATRHMMERGLTEEHLGHVCVSFYDNAQNNPSATFYGRPVTLEQYFDTPYITTPFRRHDYCTETDEANVIIITTAERARDCKSTPIYIPGVSTRHAVLLSHHYSMPDINAFGAHMSAKEVYRSAGMGPSDIDVAAIYDCFSWVVLAQIDAYGLAPGGDIAGFVAEGNLGMRGKLPTNTAGGMLSEGYTHGMNNLIELVHQLRHDYKGTPRQVEDCEVGLCTGWGGPRSSSALILSR